MKYQKTGFFLFVGIVLGLTGCNGSMFRKVFRWLSGKLVYKMWRYLVNM